MKHFFIILSFPLLLFANKNCEKGMEFFDNYEYKKAYQYFLKAKNENYPNAYYFIGNFYFHGLGTLKPNYHKYREYLWKASKMGSFLATTRLLSEHLNFPFFSKPLKGISLSFICIILMEIKNGCNNDLFSDQCHYFIYFSLFGQFIDKNLDLAEKYIIEIEKKKKMHITRAFLYIAKIKSNIKKESYCNYIDKVYRKEIKNGHLSRSADYLIFLDNHCSYKKDQFLIKSAIKAANSNSSYAQIILSIAYYKGKYGFEIDKTLSEYYLKKLNKQLKGYIPEFSPYYRK